VGNFASALGALYLIAGVSRAVMGYVRVRVAPEPQPLKTTDTQGAMAPTMAMQECVKGEPVETVLATRDDGGVDGEVVSAMHNGVG